MSSCAGRAREAAVHDEGRTLSDFIGRFELRRRAATDEFHAGVELARAGAVTIESVTSEELRAAVRDSDPQSVRVVVEDGGLTADCSCATGGKSVCRHQVAAVHSLWIRDRFRLEPREP
jgi:uncharacterized Zn finger protein